MLMKIRRKFMAVMISLCAMTFTFESSEASDVKLVTEMLEVIGLKQVCDDHVEGFTSRSRKSYAKWRERNKVILKKLETRNPDIYKNAEKQSRNINPHSKEMDRINGSCENLAYELETYSDPLRPQRCRLRQFLHVLRYPEHLSIASPRHGFPGHRYAARFSSGCVC